MSGIQLKSLEQIPSLLGDAAEFVGDKVGIDSLLSGDIENIGLNALAASALGPAGPVALNVLQDSGVLPKNPIQNTIGQLTSPAKTEQSGSEQSATTSSIAQTPTMDAGRLMGMGLPQGPTLFQPTNSTLSPTTMSGSGSSSPLEVLSSMSTSSFAAKVSSLPEMNYPSDLGSSALDGQLKKMTGQSFTDLKKGTVGRSLVKHYKSPLDLVLEKLKHLIGQSQEEIPDLNDLGSIGTKSDFPEIPISVSI